MMVNTFDSVQFSAWRNFYLVAFEFEHKKCLFFCPLTVDIWFAIFAIFFSSFLDFRFKFTFLWPRSYKKQKFILANLESLLVPFITLIGPMCQSLIIFVKHSNIVIYHLEIVVVVRRLLCLTKCCLYNRRLIVKLRFVYGYFQDNQRDWHEWLLFLFLLCFLCLLSAPCFIYLPLIFLVFSYAHPGNCVFNIL